MPTKKEIETPEVITETPIVKPTVLSSFRIEKRGNDAIIHERIILSDRFAGEKGVLEFTNPNGKITYYTERPTKKYSENVVKA